MAILYSVIARQNIVLARHAGCVGNFAEVTDLLLARISTAEAAASTSASPALPRRMTYAADSYLYHYVLSVDAATSAPNGLVFLCITDDSFDRAGSFRFLASLEERFLRQFSHRAPNTAIPFAMNNEFSGVMASEMKRFNQEASAKKQQSDPDKISRLKDEVDQVREVMVANIDQLIERGERLDLLVDKTEQLNNESVSFRQTSRQLQRKMWWQNVKMRLVAGVCAVGLVYVIVASCCGGLLLPKCI